MPTRPPTHTTDLRQREAFVRAAAGVPVPGEGRGTAADRGYDYRWQQYRKIFLRQHPLCQGLGGGHPKGTHAAGCRRVATVVDHIIAHKGDPDLFWDPDNHQGLSAACHGVKTVAEDGGFGHATKTTGMATDTHG